MRTDSLSADLRATHEALARRLDIAAGSHAVSDELHPRAERPAIDTFLNAASRHNAAVLTVLLPAARKHLPDGAEEARDLVTQCRRLELALNQVKAKVYGSTYAVHLSWDDIWDHVRHEFVELAYLEQKLADHLARHVRDDDPDWVDLLHRAELRAPTRPHPWIPHQGVGGRTARALARRVDAFWDNAESRMLPGPSDHRDRNSEGHLTRWLLADPHLPEETESES